MNPILVRPQAAHAMLVTRLRHAGEIAMLDLLCIVSTVGFALGTLLLVAGRFGHPPRARKPAPASSIRMPWCAWIVFAIFLACAPDWFHGTDEYFMVVLASTAFAIYVVLRQGAYPLGSRVLVPLLVIEATLSVLYFGFGIVPSDVPVVVALILADKPLTLF